ncbi:glycosyltransferase family 2 protein [Adlercreutzia caecimuris]|uniref:glycosyltransferase family 2 protein n=1 Tax=Adlercreutzia caecimuris TaxID=671266 RepID=UPI00272B6591|nr:glycosyltransferase family A protein [Adlercreutzia caecimuris]
MNSQSQHPVVSVVVPVFNTERYLPECLDSLISQSLKDIEIICVNDGSTDGSLDVLKRYAEGDARVKVLDQKNSFAGVARNEGMKRARGEYIIFCDSDDYIAVDALEKMYVQCKRDDADICVCAGERYYEGLGLTVPSPGYLEVKRIPEVMPFNRHTNADHIFSFTTIMMFNKMFRLSFLRENQLEYGTTRNGEDVYICAMALWLAQSITVVKDPLVYYRIDRPDSLVGTLAESAVDPLQAWMSVWDEIGAELGASERSFICKVLGVMRHSFRNVTTAEAFSACYRFAKESMVSQLNLQVHPDGYYYTPWYNVFVEQLLRGDEASFMTYMLYTASRDLEAQDARRLDYRQQLRDEKRRAKREKKALTSQVEQQKKALGQLERKFSRVEWVYRLGRAVLWLPRKIRKALAAAK